MRKQLIMDLPEIKLTYKQKLILEVLKDEYHGKAFGPEMLDTTENEDLKELNINSLTWNMLRLRESGLVESEKRTYQGRILNEYRITPYVIYDAVNIK